MKYAILSLYLVTFLFGCEQYDPTGDWALFKKERQKAHAPMPQLSETGALVKDGAVAAFDINVVYQTNCANCHGDKGMGDGPGAAGSPAGMRKPRNFTDKTWQASVDDQKIYDVIVKGAVAAGLENANPTMIPWGAILDNEPIRNAMVKKVRSFGQ